MNKTILIGRIANDLDLKMTQANKKYVKFNLAVNREYKNKDGKYDADFITCQAFDQKAEFLSKYAPKGTRIALEGAIRTGKYEKDGQTIYTTTVWADKVEIVEKPKQEATQEQLDETFGTVNGTAKAKEIETEDSFY